jgi:hypothetical protein
MIDLLSLSFLTTRKKADGRRSGAVTDLPAQRAERLPLVG